jgi:SepF-like predicted cell division protein (DUF552 family)
MLTTHFHLMPRSRTVELYLHFATRLHGVLNLLRTRATLYLLFLTVWKSYNEGSTQTEDVHSSKLSRRHYEMKYSRTISCINVELVSDVSETSASIIRTDLLIVEYEHILRTQHLSHRPLIHSLRNIGHQFHTDMANGPR